MKSEYVLGLDISTTTIGVSLFEDFGEYGTLRIIEHISPKIKKIRGIPKIEGLEALFVKSDMFYDAFMDKYIDYNITRIIIEEPLLRSNNVYTVGTLLRFNGILSKMMYDKFNIVPDYISSHHAREYAFPELMGKKKVDSKGKELSEKAFANKKNTLFGAYPKDVDKKQIIWERVNELEPSINWATNSKGELIKENFDCSDAFTCVLGYMQKEKLWKGYKKNEEVD